MAVRVVLSIILVTILLIPACDPEKPADSNRVVIGISSDIESLNPLYSFSGSEASITELLYLSLVQHKWDETTGTLVTSPMLAEKWEWNEDSTSITVYLRDKAYWTDGKQITTEDVVFSFDLYSDPEVQSRFYGTFENFETDKDLHIIPEKTFEKKDSLTLKINFRKNSNPQLFDIDMPVLPKHVFNKFERKDLFTGEKGLDSITSGAFKLSRWDKNQSIRLTANEKCFLYDPENVNEIIFKIITDYNSRITQLKKGEIDLSEDIRTDDADELMNEDHLEIGTVQGREYDYIGWNNIEPGNPDQPHRLFGNPKIREALTYAINRIEILDEFLGDYGELAAGPVAPIFKDAFNSELEPVEYNPEKAKQLLKEEGWEDRNRDGVLEKGNQKFSFKLFIASGNPRRDFAATIVKNNLKAVGIETSVETLEMQVFVEKLFAREFDAWMAGWSIPIPIDLKPYWHSDIKENPLNFISYRNTKTDQILENIENVKSPPERNKLYKEFQQKIFEDKPVTFLYWIDNIVCYNKKIQNINITPLGPLHRCWEWKLR